MERFDITRDNSVLVVVDIQERLVAAMKDKHRDTVYRNTAHLLEAARLLSIPVIVTEQYPKGLGPTVDEIKVSLGGHKPIEKITFSCCGEKGFVDAVRETGRTRVILVGMETHVCVLQSCLDLIRAGYVVHMVRDAVCSRHTPDYVAGIEYAGDAGAVLPSTELLLFQLLVAAGTDEFKAISRRLR